MRTLVLTTIIAIMLLGGCKKESMPVNFNCYMADTYLNSLQPTLITGNASTLFYAETNTQFLYFQITMTGSSGQIVEILWYGLDSVGSESKLAPGTYTMPNHLLPPLTSVAGGYYSGTVSSQYTGQSYMTGGVNQAVGTGGTVTITKNTGPGGVISGTFSFACQNQNTGIDTAYITQGSFTDVPVVTQ